MFERIVIAILIPALLWLTSPRASWPEESEKERGSAAVQGAPSLEQMALRAFQAVLLLTKSDENSIMIFRREAPQQVQPGEVFTVTETLEAKVQLEFAAIVSALPASFELVSGQLRQFQVGGLKPGETLINIYEVRAPNQEGSFTLSANARGKPVGADSQGLSVTLSLEVTKEAPPPPPPPPPNQNPVASFTFSPLDPKAGDLITFDASGSTDPDGVIVNYRWNLGDGTILEGPDQIIVTHTYQKEGAYQVTLIVIDDQGAASAASSAVIAVAAPPKPTILGLPLEVAIAIGAVLTGAAIYFLVRALFFARAPSDGAGQEGVDLTGALRAEVERFLAASGLPVKEVSATQLVERVDELSRARWVRTLANNSLFIVSRGEGTLTLRAYGDMSEQEQAGLDFSRLEAASLIDYISPRVAPGDQILRLRWTSQDGQTFESYAVVDASGRLKFDTFMSLVPLAL